ncbi:hypothetical protein TELCIR_18183, partial [Teladorsagia circumcincta]
MSTVKQRYDAVRPRERVNFGGFQFVIPSPNFQMPKFQCCNGAHEGLAEPEHETDSFDLSECVKEGNDSFDEIEYLQTVTVPGEKVQHCNSDDSFDDEVILTQSQHADSARQRHDMHGQFRGFLKDDGDEFEDEGEVRLQFFPTSTEDSDHSDHAWTRCVCAHADRSLIEDQRSKMRDLGIACEALTSELNDNEQQVIYNRLMCSPPDIKLLYVTPEKIGASGRLASVFGSLHRRQFLSRFVIDEAHCVSQWGHDFRPDYTKLQSLRRDYAQPK